MTNSNIYFGPHYKTKMDLLQAGGISSIRIVSDFDRTLTQAWVGGKSTATSINILALSGLLSKDFVEKANELYNHYRPIELDNTLDTDTRLAKMTEWWSLSLQKILDEKISRDVFNTLARGDALIWRSGAQDLFAASKHYKIPFFIFSAGLGDIIQEFVSHNQLSHEFVTIFANFFKFNEQDVAVDYSRPVIHSENKNEKIIKEKGYLIDDLGRPNVIVIGDQISDSRMSTETEGKVVLKIGYLNESIHQDLELFQQAYDVVITNDAPLTFVADILQKIE